MELAILTELFEAFDKITEADIARADFHLGEIKDEEKALGTLHSEDLKKLWTLADKFELIHAQNLVACKFESSKEEEALESMTGAKRTSALEKISRGLFWLQAREDIGTGAWRAGTLGLRKGWMLVEATERKHPLQAALEGLGGTITLE